MVAFEQFRGDDTDDTVTPRRITDDQDVVARPLNRLVDSVAKYRSYSARRSWFMASGCSAISSARPDQSPSTGQAELRRLKPARALSRGPKAQNQGCAHQPSLGLTRATAMGRAEARRRVCEELRAPADIGAIFIDQRHHIADGTERDEGQAAIFSWPGSSPDSGLEGLHEFKRHADTSKGQGMGRGGR